MSYEMVKAKDVITVLSGYAFKSSHFNTECLGMPLIRIRDVGSKESKTFYSGDYDNKYIISKGDLIVGMDGEFRLAEWNGSQSLLNQRVCKITPSSDSVDKSYLKYFLPFELKKIEDTTSYVTVKHLSVKGINNIKIPFPPLDTQKKIVEILDKAQSLIDQRKEQIKEMDSLVQSLFYDMFGNLSAQDLPPGGEICSIGKQITLQRGKDITKKQAKHGTVPVISSGGISFYNDKSLVTGPGVLLGRKGSVGKVHYSSVDFWPHDTTLYIKDFNDNIPLFVYHFFKLFPINHYEASATNPSLNRNNLHPVKVGWPPISLQNTFAERVHKIEEQKDIMVKSLSELEDNFNGLMQRAFKGELV